MVETIIKWYKKLGFPCHYDETFYNALKNISTDSIKNVESYDMECNDGVKNL